LALSGRLFTWSSPALVSCLFFFFRNWISKCCYLEGNLICGLKNNNLNLFIQVISGINTGPNCGYEMYALISEMVYLLSIFYFIIDSFQNSIGSTLLPLLLQGRP
jgi:hypothetical protein